MVTPSRRERGQLVLIAAILVATSILGAVVLLNTVHSSPDVSAQTDAQSVSNSERMADQVQSELYAVFRAASGPDGTTQLPYANQSSLGAAVDAYSKQFTELAATNVTTIVDVEYNRSETGAVAHQEMGEDVVDDGAVLETVGDDVPRLFLNVSAVDNPGLGNALAVVLDESSGETRIEIERKNAASTEHTVRINGVEYEELEPPIEIELIQGAGEIHSEGAYNRTTDISSDFTDVESIDVENGGDAEWAFEFSAQGADCGGDIDADNCQDDPETIVNSVFDISYQDSNLAYSSEFTLYERDDR